MDPKDLEFEETLADSELLLKNTARSMDEDAEFTLESILLLVSAESMASASSTCRTRTGRKRTRAAGGKETAGKGRPPAEKGGDGEKNGG